MANRKTHILYISYHSPNEVIFSNKRAKCDNILSKQHQSKVKKVHAEKVKSILNSNEVCSHKLYFVHQVKSGVNFSQILYSATKLIFPKLLSMAISWGAQIRFKMLPFFCTK